MTDSWITCDECCNRYGAYISSCPICGTSNGFSAYKESKNRSTGKIAAAILIMAAVAGIVLFTPVFSWLAGSPSTSPAISILPQLSAKPESVPQEKLVAEALKEINNDREKFGLAPVDLSLNTAAQVHAEDVFKNKQISHWLSNGEKPYMTYSRYGGSGGVAQNVAIAGFDKEQYEECVTNPHFDCEKIDPIKTIKELEHEMMYNDTECCDDGHRDNILNNFRTHVSIGIAYDQYYLVLVQNFENNYGISITAEDREVMVSGLLSRGTIDHMAIYFDPPPTSETYEQNKQALSYSTGKLVAAVVTPAPFGFYYDRPDGYRLIVAREWDTSDDGKINISYDMAKAVNGDGVYTVVVIAKSDKGEPFDVASHSFPINSD